MLVRASWVESERVARSAVARGSTGTGQSLCRWPLEGLWSSVELGLGLPQGPVRAWLCARSRGRHWRGLLSSLLGGSSICSQPPWVCWKSASCWTGRAAARIEEQGLLLGTLGAPQSAGDAPPETVPGARQSPCVRPARGRLQTGAHDLLDAAAGNDVPGSRAETQMLRAGGGAAEKLQTLTSLAEAVKGSASQAAFPNLPPKARARAPTSPPQAGTWVLKQRCSLLSTQAPRCQAACSPLPSPGTPEDPRGPEAGCGRAPPWAGSPPPPTLRSALSPHGQPRGCAEQSRRVPDSPSPDPLAQKQGSIIPTDAEQEQSTERW